MKSHKTIYIFSFVYILISQIILPKLNYSDYFVFSQWKLYASPIEKIVYDYSWDNGKTYLFRDKSDLLLKKCSRRYRRKFFADTSANQINEIQKKYSDFLLRLSKNKKVVLHKLYGSLADHYIHKNKLRIL
jgi:hypothetical protein